MLQTVICFSVLTIVFIAIDGHSTDEVVTGQCSRNCMKSGWARKHIEGEIPCCLKLFCYYGIHQKKLRHISVSIAFITVEIRNVCFAITGNRTAVSRTVCRGLSQTLPSNTETSIKTVFSRSLVFIWRNTINVLSPIIYRLWHRQGPRRRRCPGVCGCRGSRSLVRTLFVLGFVDWFLIY